MKEHYHPLSVEAAAQKFWDEQYSFYTQELPDAEKFYCLSMFPYPSGDLHMGHIRNYTLGDVIARYQQQQGKQVLHPIGWDAFGLPAENAAIAHQLAPSQWTEKNIERMRVQFKQMGYSFDWSRELCTCDPNYYRWEQWLFIQLYRKGLVYKKNALVNWDPVDQTVLANEQVIDGRGWRSGALVERREISQWFLRITAYAEELLTDLQQLSGWPERVRTMQRNWIGRSEGLNIEFIITNQACAQTITIFTTRADTLFGVSYIAIAPEHPLAQQAATQNSTVADFIRRAMHTKVAEADMATLEKEGVCLTTVHAVHPLTGALIPIWVTNFVLMQYGSGAVMAVPAHDQRDFEFAQKYNIAFTAVIQPDADIAWDFSQAAYTGSGILINSNEFDGLASTDAKEQISATLIARHCGQLQVNYRLRDWGISRQRYWGTPIPIINCETCGTVPVPEQELPVCLPTHLIPDGSGSPLQSDPSFYHTTCPQCGQSAYRDTDTMDTFVESSWYYARYCCIDQTQAMLDQRCDYWLPVDQYVGGVEHAILHLLYARFFHKLLRDLGLLRSNEPFLNLLTQGMVLKDGHKMSKSKGNIVAPQMLVEQYGADTVRLFIIFAAPPEQNLEWSDHGVEGAHRFLKKLWSYTYHLHQTMQSQHFTPAGLSAQTPLSIPKPLAECYQSIQSILQQAQNDMERQQFNTVVSACMKLFNLISKIEHTANHLPLISEGMSILLRLLAPITPHICHELWRTLEYGSDILKAPWPTLDVKALQTEQVKLVIQINGKWRGEINAPRDANEIALKQIILEEDTLKRHLADKSIRKMIVVSNKLVNIVL